MRVYSCWFQIFLIVFIYSLKCSIDICVNPQYWLATCIDLCLFMLSIYVRYYVERLSETSLMLWLELAIQFYAEDFILQNHRMWMIHFISTFPHSLFLCGEVVVFASTTNFSKLPESAADLYWGLIELWSVLFSRSQRFGTNRSEAIIQLFEFVRFKWLVFFKFSLILHNHFSIQFKSVLRHLLLFILQINTVYLISFSFRNKASIRYWVIIHVLKICHVSLLYYNTILSLNRTTFSMYVVS